MIDNHLTHTDRSGTEYLPGLDLDKSGHHLSLKRTPRFYQTRLWAISDDTFGYYPGQSWLNSRFRFEKI